MSFTTCMLAAEALDVIYLNIWSILVSLLNLVIIFFILKKLLFKPVVKIVSEREHQAQTLISNAEAERAQAEQARAEYDARLETAEADAQEVIRRANATAQRQSTEIIDDAHKRAQELLKQADADIAQEKKKALNELKGEISDISLSIAEQLVGREVGEEDHRKYIDDFISSLEDPK